MQAIILAGGRGQRLDPFTRVLPKPLFPLGDEAIAGILLKQLNLMGVTEVIMCLGYLADLIMAYFQDGRRYGVPIRYVMEQTPLGTAGPLKKIEDLEEDFLVVNADELTTLNFRDLFEYHKTMGANMTVAVQKKNMPYAFGVLDIEEGQIIGFKEKPNFQYWASMGIYALNKDCLDLIPAGQRFDMSELVLRLLDVNAKVMGYASEDVWYDIGTLADFEKAQGVYAELNLFKEGYPDRRNLE